MDQNQNPSPQKNNENGTKNKQPILMLLICIMVVMFLVNLLTMTMQGGSGEIKYSEFVDLGFDFDPFSSSSYYLFYYKDYCAINQHLDCEKEDTFIKLL